jgi:SulP family sulfate permease
MKAPASSEMFTPKLITLLRRGYRLADLRADLMAGLTVAIVALPLATALAIASGAGPVQGLTTAIVAGLLISALGGSRLQIGGPTGAFVVVVADVIATHGYGGLVLATLMAGVILVVAGYARLGAVVRFIPHPVITGFTAGIAVIIAASQLKDFFGLTAPDLPADMLPKLAALARAADTLDIATCAIGLGSLALIVALRRWAPRWPGPLIAVGLASLAVVLIELPVATIGSRFGSLPEGLPAPHLPALSLAQVQALVPAAVTIAFLAGIEALLSAMVADGMAGTRHRPNQELVGQGVANVASALFGGLPATGAIARTATNIRAGARTPIAGIAHALFLLAFLMLGGTLLAHIPLAALAAVLLVVAWGMSEAHAFLHLRRLPPSDRMVLLLTFALTVLVDLTVAIAVGVGLACLLFMVRMSETLSVNRETDETEDDSQRAALPPGVEVFRLSGPLFFGVATDLVDTLQRMGQAPRVLILRMGQVPYVDSSAGQALANVVGRCRDRRIAVVIEGASTQPLGVLDGLGLGRTSATVHHAVSHDAAVALAQRLTSSGSS